MATEATKTHERLELVRRYYLKHPEGLSDKQLAKLLNVARPTITRYRLKLGARQITHGIYTLDPTKEDIAFARLILDRAGLL